MGKGLYYITNRNSQTDFGYLEFYEVITGAIQNVDFDNFDFNHSEWVLRQIQTPEEMLADLQNNMMNENRDTIFFIHGYHTGKEDALKTGLEIFNKYGDFNIVIFDWLSADRLLEYFKDRQFAKTSGIVLARAIKQYIKFITCQSPAINCNQKIHIVAHSMGNYVLCNAVKNLKETFNIKLFEFIGNTFLMAADVDWVAFEENAVDNLSLLSKISNKIVVYYNEHDLALSISENFKHALIKRLGRDGIRNINIASDDIFQVKFNTTDKEIAGDSLHCYLTMSNVVIEDINTWIQKETNKRRQPDCKMNSWILYT